MKSYEFSRYYHPSSGKFVYKHKGTGVIVDNIFKPMKAAAKAAASAVFKKFAKPVAKKALEAGISHAGEKLGKKAAEKSGDIIMKRLAKMKITPSVRKGISFSTDVPGYEPLSARPEEDSDVILNRLISGSGLKRKKEKKINSNKHGFSIE